MQHHLLLSRLHLGPSSTERPQWKVMAGQKYIDWPISNKATKQMFMKISLTTEGLFLQTFSILTKAIINQRLRLCAYLLNIGLWEIIFNSTFKSTVLSCFYVRIDQNKQLEPDPEATSSKAV